MKKIIQIILIVLIILNCVYIFNFSSEQSEKSDETSGKVVDAVVEMNPKTKKMNKKEKKEYKEKIVTPIRKTAHFTIYTSLGALLYFFNSTIDFEKKQSEETVKELKEKIKINKKFLISFICAFIYACTDEIHQLFVPGRAGQVKDVCIDSGGAIFGILIAMLIIKIFQKTVDKIDERVKNKIH